jgi:hypothetical protein
MFHKKWKTSYKNSIYTLYFMRKINLEFWNNEGGISLLGGFTNWDRICI